MPAVSGGCRAYKADREAMKKVLFSGLSEEKMTAILKKHTAKDKKDIEEYVWKAPQGRHKEWVCLTGKWTGGEFRGRIYRHYDEQTSGGIALPNVSLQTGRAGSLGQVTVCMKYSISMWVIIVLMAALALLQAVQLISALPQIQFVKTVAFCGWILLSFLICGLFHSQYQHECRAIEQMLRQMIRAFD